jgi:hypothetical protein
MQNRPPRPDSDPMPAITLADLTESITSSVLRAVDARAVPPGGSARVRPVIWCGGRIEILVGLPGSEIGSTGPLARIEGSEGGD